MKLSNIIAVGIGGALGAILRYFINMIMAQISNYPYSTLIENLSGSFVLGVLTALFIQVKVKEWLRVGFGVGLCGGFTTMSTFALDVVLLLDNSYSSMIIYITVTVLGGITLAAIGYLLGMKATRQLNRKEVEIK